ncbi:MAG: hypothetical protein MUC96_30140, partial [Myxococcaceae bacterium]|nr:hypothetical protein [Myxococcaceae bacterium]
PDDGASRALVDCHARRRSHHGIRRNRVQGYVFVIEVSAAAGDSDPRDNFLTLPWRIFKNR